MTIPFPDGRPDQSVSQDSGAQLSQGIQVLVRTVGGLERVIASQTSMMERTLSAAQRYQMAGQPQLRQDVLQQIVGAGGSLHGSRQTQVTPMGALSSLSNLQAFGAQQLGQWISGMPLYETPGGGPSGGSAGPGGTPAGTPSSASAPAGSGAAAAGAAAAAASGAPAAGAPIPPVPPRGGRPGAAAPPPPPPPRGGLPSAVFGSGAHAAPSAAATRGTAILRQVGARVAMSGGGLGSIGSQLRQLPGVGLVADAVGGIANLYMGQREAGRVYQEQEGGSNLGAQTERLHALAYQLSMFGRMPEGAAAQAFGAVTAMGYNQAAVGEGQQMQNRQSALDFIYHNYTSLGMDVGQSLQILQTASQNATVNLGNVASALKAVSDTAGQAGSNAQVMRQYFNQYFQAAQGLGAGAGAPYLAGGIAAMQASMGKEFAGVNFSGELSQSRQYLLSGMSGLTPSQLQYTARNAPQQYSRLLAGQNLQFLSAGGMMTPAMTSSMRQMIAAAGGGNAIMSNPDLRDQIARSFLNEWQVKGNINENVWAQEISGLTGVRMNPDQAFQWIVSQVAGVNEASHAAAMHAAPGATVSSHHLGAAPRGRFGLAQPVTTTTGGVLSRYSTRAVITPWQQAGSAGRNYLKFDTHGGRTRSPVLEALLQNLGSGSQVRVQTRSGPRVMPLSLAMKYYPNELMAGQVEFYDSSGKAIGDTSAITHGLVNNNASTMGEERQRTGSMQGISAARYQASHPGSVSVPAGGGRSVVISLSSEGQQLLKLLPSNHDQAAAMSQVPANPWPGQASR